MKEQSSRSAGSPRATDKPIIGICVRYCNKKTNQVEDVWIDLDSITALTWSTQNVPEHPGKQSHDGGNLKGDSRAPDCNTQQLLALDTGICWWDGRNWVCGD